MLLPLLAALAVTTLRMVLHTVGSPVEGSAFMLIHSLALVTVVFFAGVQVLRSDRTASLPPLMRANFRSAAVYALATAVMLWAYYTWFDPQYFPHRIDQLVAMGVGEGQPETVIRPRMERFFTPFNYATITLAALLLCGAVLAGISAVFQHKVLRRVRR